MLGLCARGCFDLIMSYPKGFIPWVHLSQKTYSTYMGRIQGFTSLLVPPAQGLLVLPEKGRHVRIMHGLPAHSIKGAGDPLTDRSDMQQDIPPLKLKTTYESSHCYRRTLSTMKEGNHCVDKTNPLFLYMPCD